MQGKGNAFDAAQHYSLRMVGFVDASSLRVRTPPEVVLEDIVRTIVERVHPRRIILIGSRARGDARLDSDYDVVVEMETDAKTADRRSTEVYGFFPNRNWSLNVIARTTGQIERSANDPGTIDWDIVRQGKVLYAAEDASVTLTPAASQLLRHVREGPDSSPASVGEWATRAKLDLEEARFSLQHKRPSQYVCFLAQQSAEKYLKALLVRHLVRPGRTHNLKELLVYLRGVGVHLSALDADCELLAPLAAKSRYGGLGAFDEAIARAALAAAERIAAAVAPLL